MRDPCRDCGPTGDRERLEQDSVADRDIALLAPIPIASVRTAAAVKPGFRVSERKVDRNISQALTFPYTDRETAS